MKTETYKEYLDKKQREFDNLPIKFAFSMEQFIHICNEWGFNIEEAKNKVYAINTINGYCLKEDFANIKEFFSRPSGLHEKMTNSKEFCKGAFMYQLNNHEYCITRDTTEALEALDLNIEKVKELGFFQCFKESVEEYLANCD